MNLDVLVAFIPVVIGVACAAVFSEKRTLAKQTHGSLSSPEGAFEEAPGYYCRCVRHGHRRALEYTVSLAAEYPAHFRVEINVPPLIRQERLSGLSAKAAQRVLCSYFGLKDDQPLPWSRSVAEQIAELFSRRQLNGKLAFQRSCLVLQVFFYGERWVETDLVVVGDVARELRGILTSS